MNDRRINGGMSLINISLRRWHNLLHHLHFFSYAFYLHYQQPLILNYTCQERKTEKRVVDRLMSQCRGLFNCSNNTSLRPELPEFYRPLLLLKFASFAQAVSSCGFHLWLKLFAHSLFYVISFF